MFNMEQIRKNSITSVLSRCRMWKTEAILRFVKIKVPRPSLAVVVKCLHLKIELLLPVFTVFRALNEDNGIGGEQSEI